MHVNWSRKFMRKIGAPLRAELDGSGLGVHYSCVS
jgi:hypothetical protein